MATSSATETWTGTNGAAWSTQWNVGTNYGTNVSSVIQSDQGVLDFGDTMYGSVYALLRTEDTYNDTDLTLTLAALPDQGNILVSICATSAGNEVADYGYTLIVYCFGGAIGALQLVRSNGPSSATDLMGYTGVSLANNSYKVRLQRSGSTIRFKIWLASDAEPGAWYNSSTDASPIAAGRARLGLQYTASASDHGTTTFDDLAVTGTIYVEPTVPLIYHGPNAASSLKVGNQNVSSQYIGYNKVYPFPSVAPVNIDPAMPTGQVSSNGNTWIPSYSNDFTTDAAIGSFMTTYSGMGYYDGFNDTSGRGLYDPNKVLSAHDSYLDIYLHTENSQPLVSTILLDNYAPHDSMRVSMRVKTIASGVGYKFVGILWPSSNVWNDGEIDWPEAELEATPRPAVAMPGTFGQNQPGQMVFTSASTHYAPTDSSGWHIATTEWTSDYINFYWDDVLLYSETDPAAIPTVPMRMTLQAETFINQGPVPAGSTGHVLIDWIVIYDQA